MLKHTTRGRWVRRKNITPDHNIKIKSFTLKIHVSDYSLIYALLLASITSSFILLRLVSKCNRIKMF